MQLPRNASEGERSQTKMEMMLARALRKKLGMMENTVPK